MGKGIENDRIGERDEQYFSGRANDTEKRR